MLIKNLYIKNIKFDIKQGAYSYLQSIDITKSNTLELSGGNVAPRTTLFVL